MRQQDREQERDRNMGSVTGRETHADMQDSDIADKTEKSYFLTEDLEKFCSNETVECSLCLENVKMNI